MSHANNPQIVNRLRRAQGHLATVLRMVEEGKDGLAIAQQMSAVIQALEKAKGALVLDHIEHHLEETVGPLPREARAKLVRLGELAKYL
ncbi:MAG: metal-sensing transcriptional repressor [Rhodospirillaceae bacterium]|nr:MAG: metal-sensing transcriptional repressor [Rhodospirillaceae bacterium]